MSESLHDLLSTNSQVTNIHAPIIYRIGDEEGKLKLESLLTENPSIMVYDDIMGQLKELVKLKDPRNPKPSSEELEEKIKNELNGKSLYEYGVWVYYPWSKKLVHLLDEEEFVDVRTNRNQYKITPEEKKVLSEKKIGIIGLSVGQSIALTLAMERSFGEIRLADFDILELSNLNRIRTGTHNLGTLKTIAVAREIMEIDPFLKVVCFSEGLSENNLDEFLTSNGKLDVLVDECDGLYMKILSRQRAKYHKIPVVMDTSDRGMLDIERFDLEPDRPILHGLIDHLDLSKVKEAKTNEEKVPYLLPMIGIDSASTRLKSSMLEIEQSITTWPQLASSVVLGGGVGADTCRRILLNQLNDSGRYYVDLEKFIGKNDSTSDDEVEPVVIKEALTTSEMFNLIDNSGIKSGNDQVKVPEDDLKLILEAATRAPSGANIQPWKWVIEDKDVFLFYDDRYNAGLLDWENTTSIIGLGSATENLVLKSHELGYEVQVNRQNLNYNSAFICNFKFYQSGAYSSHSYDKLVGYIDERLTNRNIGERIPIAKEKLNALVESAKSIDGCDLIMLDSEDSLRQLKEITAPMDRIRVTHKGGHKDFRAEIRWNKQEVEEFRNGVDIEGTVDLTPTEFVGWKMAKDWKVINNLNKWGVGSGLEKIQRKSIDSSSAVGLLVQKSHTQNQFFESGRALERVWLAATSMSIQVHPASLSTLIYNTAELGGPSWFNGNMYDEVMHSKSQFEKLFDLESSTGKVVLLRFFIGDLPKKRTLRYNLDDVIIHR